MTEPEDLTKVEVYDTDSDTSSGLPDFAPEGASMGGKDLDIRNIPRDTDVEIWVNMVSPVRKSLTVSIQDCAPCEVCKEFKVWVSTDQLCPAESDQIVKVTASCRDRWIRDVSPDRGQCSA